MRSQMDWAEGLVKDFIEWDMGRVSVSRERVSKCERTEAVEKVEKKQKKPETNLTLDQ